MFGLVSSYLSCLAVVGVTAGFYARYPVLDGVKQSYEGPFISYGPALAVVAAFGAGVLFGEKAADRTLYLLGMFFGLLVSPIYMHEWGTPVTAVFYSMLIFVVGMLSGMLGRALLMFGQRLVMKRRSENG